MLKVFAKKEASFVPPLQFRNTLSGEIETFVPLTPSRVLMYNCGPTVYDRVHIGNLRSYIFADTLRRALDYWNYRVTQVINITDVGHLVSDADEGEDKVEQSAKRQGRSAQEIADEYTDFFFKDLDHLGINRSNIEWPRATNFIREQIALVQTLQEKGYAYRIKDGVYFDTSRFPSYGKLGGIRLSQLREGARVKENQEKHNPHDFALWKSSGRKKRQQEWNSPWGKGFPGWHIECTAMIFKLLGKQIDIHTGGIDHIPIHHNNEIAQAEAATGKRYVKYWMHNEFITIEGKKISKSLGNTIYLHQIIERGIAARALRYWFLTAHYRSPINFTWDALEGAAAARERLLQFFVETSTEQKTVEIDSQFMRVFLEAIANDLDTPKALACVWDLVHDNSVSQEAKHSALIEVDKLLGIGLSDPREMSKIEVILESELPSEVRKLLEEREESRKSKDFTKADELRSRIAELGYEISDSSSGPIVRKK